MRPHKVDYRPMLTLAAETNTPQTAKNVKLDDMQLLTRRLRNQARSLGLEIHISTDRQSRSVTVKCSKASDEHRRVPPSSRGG
jgi:hypothetical protein